MQGLLKHVTHKDGVNVQSENPRFERSPGCRKLITCERKRKNGFGAHWRWFPGSGGKEVVAAGPKESRENRCAWIGGSPISFGRCSLNADKGLYCLGKRCSVHRSSYVFR